ncbi:MAG: DUF1223 domain-containing protein [Novosphingobium sp.]|nr:DUF1223 domain-containing protein [Novosphingobium sp.]MCP5402072.1 DUF1223 domain-containing protein [Novosphingobium sp.]
MKLPFLVASLAFALSVAAGFGHAADTSQAPASGGDGAARPVVLELFTSQGCSSCPPADRLAGILARDPSLLVITRPVTYWDRLGWKDTLARAENTDLQRAYSRRISTGQGVYTPQIVVNGRYGAVGSREKQVRALISWAKRDNGPAIAIRQADNGGFGIGLSGKANYRLELVLVALDSSERVRIGSGENSGRNVVYTNVVKDELRLGEWRGGTRSFQIEPSRLAVPGADRYAVLLRQPDGGVILGAAVLTGG